MKNKKLSLIISTYNQPDFLDLTFASIENQTFRDFEIIIADDGSDKRTLKIVKKYRYLPLIHVWHPDKGYRKSIILNKAIKKTSSEYLVFIDGDCLLHKDFLYYHYHYRQQGCFLTGRRVKLGEEFTRKCTIEKIKNGYLDRINFNLLISCIKKDSGYFHRSIPVKNKIIRSLTGWDEVYDILGSNLSLYKNELVRVNGFNEDLKNYWGEDGDLFIRLRNSGYKINSVKNLAVQYHLFHPRREPDNNVKKWYYDSIKKDYIYRFCANGLKKTRKNKFFIKI